MTIQTESQQHTETTEGRIKWSRSADIAWGSGATILALVLTWLLYGPTAVNAVAPVVSAPQPGAVVAADERLIVEGSAAPNQRVSIVGNDQPLGDVTAGADGSFSYELAGLEPGAYNLTVNAVDEAGQDLTASAPVQFMVTESRLAAPVTLLPEDQMPTVTLPEDGLAFDVNEERALFGSGLPGATITILNGETPIAAAQVAADGQWSLQLPALDPGAYTLMLKQSLPDGQEMTLPEPLAVLIGGLKAPQLVMPVEGLKFAPGQPVTLEGTGAPGATITVSDATGAPVGTATVDDSGQWTMTMPALAEGENALTVTQTTAEGQEVAMSQPVTVSVGEVTTSAAGGPAAAGAPAVTSPAEGEVQPAGQPVTLEGTGAPGATITVSDAAGKPLGTATVDDSGQWALTAPALAEGEYSLTVTQTTAEGQEVVMPQPVTVSVGEVTTPAAAGAAGGPAATGEPAAAGAPAVTSPAEGEVQPVGQPVALEGTGTPGATITVSDAAGKPLGTATVDDSGQWALTAPALAEGEYSLTVTQTTAEGQEVVMPQPVAVSVGEGATSATTGAAAAGEPAVTSPAEGEVQPAGLPVTLEGTGVPGATITVSDAAGKPLGTAVVSPTGAWSLTLTGPAAGEYAWSVTQTTLEGEEMAMAEPVTLTVAPPDFILPEVTKPGTDLNVMAGATLTLAGIGQPGATVAVLEGAKPLAKTQVDPTGSWTAEIAGLAPGEHSLSVMQTMSSGAKVEAAIPVSVTVVEDAAPVGAATTTSTSGATAATAPVFVGDAPASVQPGQMIRGKALAGALVELYAGTRLLGTAQADQQGNWQFLLPVSLPRTTRGLTIKVLDASGAPLSESEVAIFIGPPLTLPVTGGAPITHNLRR